MNNSDGFVPIVAVFYAVFHPTEGTKIVYQVPENSITTKSLTKAKDKNGTKVGNDVHRNVIGDEIDRNTENNDGDHEVNSHATGNGETDDRDDSDDNDHDSSSDADDDDDISDKGLFNFDTVKNYIIPKSQLCNKLISVQIGKYKVMGYPVNIENTDYARNSFNFNFCFVFDYNSDTTPYEAAIERMGKMFRVLEEQLFVLSKLDKEYIYFKNRSMVSPLTSSATSPGLSTPNGNEVGVEFIFNPEGTLDHLNTPGHKKTKNISLSSIESLIYQIYQDLNNYSECCIPIDLANSVDIKLFPIFPPPVNIKAHHVPIATVKLHLLVDSTWDPTMVKILPYINGINSIKRISELADADYILTKQCIQHFMHYECIEILDIFQFSNIYAPTNYIGNFLKLQGMAEECQAYVVADSTGSFLNLPFNSTNGFNSMKSGGGSILRRDTNETHPSNKAGGSKSGSMTPNSQAPILKQLSVSYALESPSKSYMQSARGPSATPGSKIGNGAKKANICVPSKATLFYLYRSLNQRLALREWFFQHQKLLVNVDIRRLINFGVSRGIIYRVHSYPILSTIIRSIENDGDDSIDALIHQVRHVKRVSFTSPERTRKEIIDEIIHEGDESSSKLAHTNAGVHSEGNDESSGITSGNATLDYSDWSEVVTEDSVSEDDWSDSSDEDDNDHEARESRRKDQEMVDLIKLLKGFQPYDSICSYLHKSRAEVREMLEALGPSSEINA